MQKDSTTLSAEDILVPVDAYSRIKGPIKYTASERAEWEAKMQERAFKNGEPPFNPLAYPKTHMIPDQ